MKGKAKKASNWRNFSHALTPLKQTCIVDKKMSMKPIMTMVKSRKFQVFWWTAKHMIHSPTSALFPSKIFFTNLQISLVMLPQALGYDCREALNGENHHENHLKVTNW